jgi:hypothetical protein
MKIHILAPQRRKPQIGDRRTTKKHGLQIRVIETHNGMWVRSGSRYRYDWRKPEQLVGTRWEHLLNADDRKLIDQRQAAASHKRDIEAAIFSGGPACAT